MKCKVMKKGITLLEILVVLVILAIVGGAIIGRMLSGIERARVQAAGRQLVSHIRLAQERAKLEQRNITVDFSAANETYKVYQAGGSFDGIDDYVEVANFGNFTSVSAEAWVYITGNTGARESIISYKENSAAGFVLCVNEDGVNLRPRLWVRVGGSWLAAEDTTGLSLNTWYHITGTYNGNNILLYINGTQKASTSAVGSMTQATDITRIGSRNTATNYFRGRISEVRIYNRALTAGEISYSYTYKKPQNRAGLVGWWKLDEGGGSTASDSSGYGNNGTITGATWTQGTVGYLKDPAKGYQDINYDFNQLSEFKGVSIYSVDF
jgi:prepilin-type N-terminal cleavage/methylation domain-containing protein